MSDKKEPFALSYHLSLILEVVLAFSFDSSEMPPLTAGADIVPKVTTLRAYDPPRTVADTEEGASIRRHDATLERLAEAYEQGVLLEDSGPPH